MFPAEAIRQAGYHAVWRGEKRWNGVETIGQLIQPPAVAEKT